MKTASCADRVVRPHPHRAHERAVKRVRCHRPHLRRVPTAQPGAGARGGGRACGAKGNRRSSPDGLEHRGRDAGTTARGGDRKARSGAGEATHGRGQDHRIQSTLTPTCSPRRAISSSSMACRPRSSSTCLWIRAGDISIMDILWNSSRCVL